MHYITEEFIVAIHIVTLINTTDNVILRHPMEASYMGDNTLESMQQQRPSNLTVDATISPEGIIELGISNSCIFVLSHGRTALPNVLSLN